MRRENDHPLQHYLIAISSICLLCVLVYSNTFNSPFVFDDTRNIEENRFIRLTDLDFNKLYDAGFKSPTLHRPVVNISFALNYYFGKYDVTGYHVVNTIIHSINGILVYFLALILFKQLSEMPGQRILQFRSPALMSLFAAFFFVAHPLQTQSVTYIVQRMNSMAVMFYLLSLFLYISGRMAQTRRRRWPLLSGCLVSWIMALGSKEIALTLPFIILLYEFYFFQDLHIVWEKREIKYLLVPIAILSLTAFIYVGAHPFDRILDGYGVRDFTMWERVLTQFNVVVFYISLLFYPHPSRLNLVHQFPISHSLSDPVTTLFSVILIIGFIGLAVYLARKNRLISFCILWFLITLAVESSVIGLEMIFEHRLYLPMFGFALIVTYVLFFFLSQRPLWFIPISILIIVSLGTATYLRNSIWHDRITLWSDAVTKEPLSPRAHNNLGLALKEQGRLEEAIGHFSAALQIRPDHAHAHNNLGVALRERGRPGEAVGHFSQALRIQPNHADAHNNLGLALQEQGRLEEAISHFSEALRIKPNMIVAHYNMGNALKEQGRFKEAIGHFSEALQIKPDHAEAHNNLGIALANQGLLKEAIGHFSRALRIDPRLAEAHNNLGLALARQGNLKNAIIHFSEALRIKSDYADARHNLGVCLKEQERLKELGI
jgi:Flp pilus assembly protein TadD